MFRFWTEGTPEAEDFCTILVGFLSESAQGAADPNELLRIAARIPGGNREDWVKSFAAEGERRHAIAETAARCSHQRTAGESYLRAFTYFRCAELMLPSTEPRKGALYDQTIACFPLGLNHAGYLL